MAVIQRREGPRGVRYRVQVRISGQPARSATFDRHADAKEWAAKVEREARLEAQGIAVPVPAEGAPLLADVVERYRVEVLATRAPSTRRAKSRHLDYWAEVLGHVAIDEVSPALIAECREHLRTTRADGKGAKRAPATVNRHLETLAHLLSVAVREWQLIAASPATAVRHLPEPQGRVRILSAGELERLLEACRPQPTLYLAVLLAVTTGLRAGELLTLRWADLDLEARSIHVERTKSGKRRTVPLPAVAVPILAERRGTQAGTCYVFPQPRRAEADRPTDSSQLRWHFHRALEAAGIEGFRWHDLRHTAASYLAMSGATLRDLAEILGHSSLAMVQRYSHLTTDHLREAVDRMAARRGLT